MSHVTPVVAAGLVCWLSAKRGLANMHLWLVRESLEERVAQRTAQLAEANEALRREIAELKRLQERLAHQSAYDHLTSLPNRTLFYENLERSLSRAQRGGGAVAILFIDLDNFKAVNDSLGHQAGDRLLTILAGRLREHLRTEDVAARSEGHYMAARLGGDEFTVLLENIASVKEARRVASRLQEELRLSLSLSDREVHVSVSIGVAISSPKLDSPEELLRAADLTMYRAKNRGKGRYEVFDAQLDMRCAHRFEPPSAPKSRL